MVFIAIHEENRSRTTHKYIMMTSHLNRLRPHVGLFMKRGKSTAAAIELPTQHSLKQPPRVCLDPVELEEQTQKLLEAPIGSLFASKATADGDRDHAYDLAFDTIRIAEYLQLGYSRQIPGSLYAPENDTLQGTSADPIAAMQSLVGRVKAEGDMYMQLRSDKLAAQAASDPEVDDGYLSSSEGDSSDSSSDDDSSDSSDEGVGSSLSIGSGVPVFSTPGVTARLQEALLDAMASVGEAQPLEYAEIASQVIDANTLDNGTNMYTIPTHVTFNAPLRGIAKLDTSQNDEMRDQAISCAFQLYSNLTHSEHLPRNPMTFIYMFQILNNVFPTSRVKGNMSATFWSHASHLGVVNEQVLEAFKQVHEPTNGPEFQILLDHVNGELPQKYGRYTKKYAHSRHY